MSRSVQRHPLERRARIRRAIAARRRREAARWGIVVCSVSALLAGGVVVYTLASAFHQRAENIQPLMRIDTPATRGRPINPVAMTIDPPAAIEPVAPLEEMIRPIADDAVDATMQFNGRAVRPVGTVKMVVTAYSPDERSCGRFADGKTAAGYSVFTNGGKLAAADTSILPFGSLIGVPGYDEAKPVPVLDVGGKIKGYRLDVLFPTHRAARKWGVQTLDVTVYEFAD